MLKAGSGRLKITSGYLHRLFHSRLIIASICAIGVSLVAYGMAFKNDPIFIAGIIVVIAAYLIIRKHLKESLKHGQGANKAK